MRLVKLDYERSCSSNVSKFGKYHPETQYVSGRLASKNLQEFTGGRWTAKIKLNRAGEAGMFPAWWILGARNNEPPIQEDDKIFVGHYQDLVKSILWSIMERTVVKLAMLDVVFCL